MSVSLPDRPNLDQLRRQAKELRDAARHGDSIAVERFARHYGPSGIGGFGLAAAQLVVARELGFSSWPRLKVAVEARLATVEGRVEAFVAASVEGRMSEAASILEAAPTIARASLVAAAVLGDTDAVGEMLAVDPAAAVAIDDGRGWPPLLYVCYSCWHLIDGRRAAGLAAVARLLLDAGASPATNNGGSGRSHTNPYHSALGGSVEVNDAEVTAVLLEAGANPNDHQCIGRAAEHGDHRCLDLLLAAGASVAGTWAVDAAVGANDPGAVTILMEALRHATGQTAPSASEALPDAAANASSEVVAALLDAGADPNTGDDQDFSALRRAVRCGRSDTAALLARHGAPDDSTDMDRFIGACVRADRLTAEALMAGDRDMLGRLTDDDRAVLVDAAGSNPVAAVALMVDLGLSPEARNASGEQPLHVAAYAGNAEVVRFLIDAGADVDARDANFDATPLAFATVGSGERAGQTGNWVDTVRTLVDAGASREGVWIADKPPSEEIVGLLRSYGITPDVEPEIDDGQDDVSYAIEPGVIGDIAQHLEAAYCSVDFELFGSLLHPEVRWRQTAQTYDTSSQFLDRFRRALAAGIQATVQSVEVDRDAVLIGLTITWPADGARPAPTEHLYQVFTVDDGQIVEIRDYPDRPSALTRY